MMVERNVKKLINNLECSISKNVDFEINNIIYDSKIANENDIFVCLKGANFDSHSKIEELIEKKIKVFVVEEDNEFVKNKKFDDDIVIIKTKNTRIALALISKNYFQNDKNELKKIAITGTKGKTTTAFMIKNMLEKAGYNVGIIGTIGVFYNDKYIMLENTTPESYILEEIFYKMREEKIDYVIMEVSSQSLKYNRIYNQQFLYSIWTNIEIEHIGANEHSDYNDYLMSKLHVFTYSKNAIINGKSQELEKIINKCKNENVNYIIQNEIINMNLKLAGNYNLDNAKLAFALGKELGIEKDIIIKGIEETIVKGRCENVFENEDIKIIVDFAHEKNGTKNFLLTMKEYIKENQKFKRIVVIFGCGGNRAKERRYGMGEVVGEFADFAILTADNSRYEKTIDIINDIETTIKNFKKLNDLENGYIIIENRFEAIKYAILNSKKGDLICVIGKGHETTNEVNGIKTHFSDSEAIYDIIKELNFKE